MYIWIPEPQIPDETYADRGESTLHWLRRSTTKRAKDCREFLNHNLGQFPIQLREKLIKTLDERWQSALFELIVARYLQELGADIYYEEQNMGGKRPDFTAVFSDGIIVLEVINPIINQIAGRKMKSRNPLLDFIESIKPDGWNIFVNRLPEIGPSDSKKEFKAVIRKFFTQLDSVNNNNDVEFSEFVTKGEVSLTCTKTNKPYKHIAIEPAIAFFDDTKERIEFAINEKRKQVRDSIYPVILVINACGIASDFEDFDTKLFGHTCDVYNNKINEIDYTYFNEDGLFTKNRDHNPTYAGVLAFIRSGLFGGTPPILYLHPYFHGKLPKSILKLEQKFYDTKERVIYSKQAEDLSFIENLKFPRIR